MDGFTILIAILVIIALAAVGAVSYVFIVSPSSSQSAGLRGLMGVGALDAASRSDAFDDLTEIEEIKRRTGSSVSKRQKEDVATKLFKAGYYTASDRRKFYQIQIVTPFVTTAMFAVGGQMLLGSATMTVVVGLLGVFVGFAAPLSWLERKIRDRQEDVMYYLPLVIEQVSIGVSSSLDIGPCISHIVQMADERDSHNPVTEMFVHVEKLIRSGLNLEDSLAEVGEAHGMTELKHAFMFLAQCARHGGEVSKQLQELADSVMTQRQVQVEARITALPVKATGPLAMVFAGFFVLLFAGLLIRLMSAFGG